MSGFRKAIVWSLLTISLSCAAENEQRLYSYKHLAMGTEFALYLYAKNEDEARSISDEAFDEIDRIEQELSNYRDSSELSRINQHAASGVVTTDPETFRFLMQAQHWSTTSDGAFDMTVGPLMKAWGFFRSTGHVPNNAELEKVRGSIGYQHVKLDADTRTVHFTARGVELDPGGIGKGFAVDAVVAILHANGVHAALISAGSSTLYGVGHPPGQAGWRVLIPGASPDDEGISTVLLRDTSLSSANCNEKNFVAGGHLYCHIMDPRTLRPVEGRLHVSVMDPSATTSDALSNVLFVDRPKESITFLMKYAPDARAIILSGSRPHAQCTAYRWQADVQGIRCSSFPSKGLPGVKRDNVAEQAHGRQ